jgi:hypothetical protein
MNLHFRRTRRKIHLHESFRIVRHRATKFRSPNCVARYRTTLHDVKFIVRVNRPIRTKFHQRATDRNLSGNYIWTTDRNLSGNYEPKPSI